MEKNDLIYSAVGFRIRPSHCSARALKVVWGLNFNPTNYEKLMPETDSAMWRQRKKREK